jgi:[ribosomal protein S5]-alanine N-acetyltransferase
MIVPPQCCPMASNSQAYFLSTKRLGFRAWWDGDLELALDLWGDHRVTALIGGPFTAEQARQQLALEIRSQQTHGLQLWPIFRLSDEQHIGSCGLRLIGNARNTVELSCHLKFEQWGYGYAAEAAHRVIHHAFNDRGVGELFTIHHALDLASARIVARLGFKLLHHELTPATGLLHPRYNLRWDDPVRRLHEGDRRSAQPAAN